MFLKDFVPDWTGIPLGLFITMKLSLFSITNSPYLFFSFSEGLYLIFGRIATIYYFVHFVIILPILGFKEKTVSLPVSISEPVLGGKVNLANAKSSKIEDEIKNEK